MTTRPITSEDLDLLGYHPFHAEPFEDDAPEPFGSFEVFWHDGDMDEDGREIFQRTKINLPCLDCGKTYHVHHIAHPATEEEGHMWGGAGFYWWPCFPGCLPDGEPSGPFESARAAIADADEWNPILDR